MATVSAVEPKPETSVEPRLDTRTILRGVPWALYSRLRDLKENDHVRMNFLDGTLIFMSPEYIHEESANFIALLVRMASTAFGIDVKGLRTTTLRRKGVGPKKGSGKEPDDAFYVGPNERRMRKMKKLDLSVDPPPDLAIEVDNFGDTDLALSTYARLGVRELWVYKARGRTMWFGRLDGASYTEIDRSICLPRLIPASIVHALGVFEGGDMSENAWVEWLRDWARTLPEPPAT